MTETTDKFQVPPKVSKTMLKITEGSRPEEALGTILKEYLEGKIEEKWGMNFERSKNPVNLLDFRFSQIH